MGDPEAGEVRRGRQEEPSGRRERRGGQLLHPLGPGELAELPGRFPALQSPIQAAWALGAEKGGRGDQEKQTEGANQVEQERSGGSLPHPLDPRKPAGLPGEVPCPLRPGVGGTPGPLLFLEPKPRPPQPPGLFQPCGS